MNFKKYQHIERLGTQATEGIRDGRVYIFPKLDGTNSSVWLENGEIVCGSRNKELTISQDNANFYKEMLGNQYIKNLLRDYPHWRLYGEWLVPHALKTYEETAWKHFYVFDIVDETTGNYIPYIEYENILSHYKVLFIPVLQIITNPTIQEITNVLENNTFLVEKGIGEGIVLKNYNYTNKYGHVIWAKVISDEFYEVKKEKPKKLTENEREDNIIEKYMSVSFIQKEIAKLAPFTNKDIPRVLETIWREFIVEETYNFIKDKNNSVINFKILKSIGYNKIKKEVLKCTT